MPKILLVAAREQTADLDGSVLFRDEYERMVVSDPAAVQSAATHLHPHMVVIHGQPAENAEEIVRQLKHAPETRRASVVVILPGAARGSEMALRRAGANLAIPAPLDPMVWDDTLEELLAQPRRRDARIPARFVVWPQTREAAHRGTALNLSVRGMLLETHQPLELGSTIEAFLELPETRGGAEVVGQVVRESRPPGAPLQYGVDFMVLRGNSRGEIHTFVESDTEH
jgi:DNA-binding response OmpR family regulator